MKDGKANQYNLSRRCDLIFLAALAALLTYIVWLPSFPNGDGGLHGYYVQIFHELASSSTFYSQYYAIRHLVQPYCLHYFALIFLEHWLAPLKAEEVFVALILLTTAIGFRFMARHLGAHASLASLFVLPMLLDWTLGAGFLNYCFATGIVFWAVGFWNMPASRLIAGLGFAASLFLLVMSHPVPLMVLIFLMACDLGLQLWQHPSRQLRSWLIAFRWRFGFLAAACLALLIPASMAEKSKVTSVWRDCFPHRSVFVHFIEARSLGYFAGGPILVLLYSAALLLLFPATIILLQKDVRARWSTRSLTAADRQFLIITAFLVGTITMPRTVAGGSSFSERLWDVAWPLVFVTGASAAMTLQAQRRTAILATLFLFLTALVAAPRLYALSLRHAAFSQIPLPRDQKGLLLEPATTALGHPMAAAYPVFFWAGARAFSASHAVLLNSGWLEERQIPVRAGGHYPLPSTYLPSFTVSQPEELTREIAHREPAALRALHDADFLLYSAPNETPKNIPAQVADTLGSELAGWDCRSGDFYVLCLRKGGRK